MTAHVFQTPSVGAADTSTMDTRMQQDLDQYIEVCRAQWRNLGLAVAVVRRNKVIYVRGFGQRRAGRAEAVTPDTLFQVGSTTKAFTAAAIGTLVDEGRLGWDDPIAKHDPRFKLNDPSLTRKVTIADALSHRTGVNEATYLPALAIMDGDMAAGLLADEMADLPFRASYKYSNLMYAAVGRLMEAVTGRPWAEFVQKRIFDPLSMQRSRATPYACWPSPCVAPTYLGSAIDPDFARATPLLDNLAMPHSWDAEDRPVVLPWQSYDNAAAAGSIVSSAADMANWLSLNLATGRFGGAQVLAPETVAQLHALHNPSVDAPQFPFAETGEGYALGWRRAEYGGAALLAHGGGIIGFAAHVAMIPQYDIAVVTLSNGSALAKEDLGSWKLGLNKAIALRVFDHILGLPLRNWSDDFFEGADEARRRVNSASAKLTTQSSDPPVSREDLEAICGIYRPRAGRLADLRISRDGGVLYASFPGDGAFQARLEASRNGSYRVLADPGVRDLIGPQFITFTDRASGRAASLEAFGEVFQRVEA